MKVVTSYPEVNLYWLLNGKGTFPLKKEGTASPAQNSPPPIKSSSPERIMQKIIILYTDGSFETYEPSINPSK